VTEECTMFCPHCRGEHLAGALRCDDCEVDLVTELPGPSEPVDPWVLATVFATGDLALLAQAKCLLDGAGIPYLARGEGRHDLLAQSRPLPGAYAEPMEILVRAEQWEEAGALLGKASLAPVEVTPEEQEVRAGREEGEELNESAVAPTPVPSRWTVSSDRLRAGELALVLIFAFGPSVFLSARNWWIGRVGAAERTVFGSILGAQHQLLCLALLAYVLSRRGKTFRDLGLTFRWVDMPAGLLLTFAGYLAQALAWRSMDWVSVVATGHRIPRFQPSAPIGGSAWVAVCILSIVIDPVFEEMIARAFTMTEVEALAGGTAVAVLVSVVLQTSYHLYLGTAAALAAGATFLVCSCFYARFRRITPVILSHAIWNAFVAVLHRL